MWLGWERTTDHEVLEQDVRVEQPGKYRLRRGQGTDASFKQGVAVSAERECDRRWASRVGGPLRQVSTEPVGVGSFIFNGDGLKYVCQFLQ